MRRLSIVVAAIAAALSMTAVAGAASASASTVLCSAAETSCSTAHVLPSGSNVVLGDSPEHGSFRLGSPFNGISCNYAIINSRSTSEAGNPLSGQSEVSLNAAECGATLEKGAKRCTSMTSSSPSETFTPSGSGAGTINVGSASNPLTISYTCYSYSYLETLSCTYKAAGAIPIHYNAGSEGYLGTIKGSETPLTLVSGSSSHCDGSSKIEANLESGGGTAGYIATHTATVLCSAAETSCSTAHLLPSGSNVVLGDAPGTGSFRLGGAGNGISCNYAIINSHSTSEAGNPLPGQSEVSLNAAECGATLEKGGKRCESMTSNSPSETFVPSGSGAGTINVGSASNPLTISYTCYSYWNLETLSCTYKATGAIPIHYNPSSEGYPGTIKGSETPLTLVSGSSHCEASSKIEASLESSGGRPFVSTA